MWARQNHARKWSIRRITVVTCLAAFATYVAFSFWKAESRLYEVRVECGKLDPAAIKLDVAKLYVGGLQRGNVSKENADGTRTSYPLYPFTLQEYLTKYPDCCHYYPDELSSRKLSRRQQLEGMCGSIDVLSPNDYIKDGRVMEGAGSGMNWLFDVGMNLIYARAFPVNSGSPKVL